MPETGRASDRASEGEILTAHRDQTRDDYCISGATQDGNSTVNVAPVPWPSLVARIDPPNSAIKFAQL